MSNLAEDFHVLGISGSLRQNSSNSSLLLAAKNLSPAVVKVKIYPSLDRLPFYNPDLDQDAVPATVQHFRDSVATADALLISTPEYAHGIPGLLKNALDWLVSDVHFGGKPVGLIFGSATDGGFAQTALLEVLKTMSAQLVDGAVINIPGVRSQISSEGKILSQDVALKIHALIDSLRAVGR